MRLTLLLPLLLACLPLASGATTLAKLDLPALARASDVVVRARVEGISARWSGDRRRILTEVRVRVLERMAGDCGEALRLVQPGGVVGDIGQKVDGVPAFTPGEEAVLFLERQGPVYALVGLSQGKWSVERLPSGALVRPVEAGARVVDLQTGAEAAPPAPLPLEALVRQVRSATGGGK
jgi:hypothetical protein